MLEPFLFVLMLHGPRVDVGAYVPTPAVCLFNRVALVSCTKVKRMHIQPVLLISRVFSPSLLVLLKVFVAKDVFHPDVSSVHFHEKQL
jgi:hypothetical protein